MRKLQIFNFRISFCQRQVIYLLVICGLVLGILPIHTAYGAESTPSAEIQTKLDELKKEIASKAAVLKEAIGKKLKNKAYIGKVKAASENSLTLATRSGPKIASVNEDTAFESEIRTRRNLSQKTIEEEDFLIALGDIDETAVLTAKKVILTSEPEESKKTSLWGQVIAISDKLTTIKNRDNKNIAVSWSTDSKVKLNEFVILTGVLNETEIFEAEFVYVVPQGGFLRSKKVATPSSETATKSP